MPENRSFYKPPKRHFDPAEHLRLIVQSIWNILDGKLNSTGSVTLTASAATTTVTDRRIGNDSSIHFMPLTANAATELYGATMYIKSTDIDPRNSQFTINHANNAQTDRDFRYTIIG